MLEVSGIQKAFKKNIVLRDITFQASCGDCIGIIGANGCGKSTLLSILSGAIHPDAGEVRLDQQAFSYDSAGYVPQENPFIEGLTVMDHLLLWYPDTKKEMHQRLKNGSLSFFELESIKNAPIETLSGGMQKRVSIALALARSPRILILDEPTAALDLSCKSKIRAFLKSYLDTGGIVILSSHEEEDFSLLTHPYYLENGTLTLLSKETLFSDLRERMNLT